MYVYTILQDIKIGKKKRGALYTYYLGIGRALIKTVFKKDGFYIEKKRKKKFVIWDLGVKFDK